MHVDGNKLKALRTKYNLTRLDLACEVDCSHETITKVERGERSGLCVVYKLAKFFNIAIEELIV